MKSNNYTKIISNIINTKFYLIVLATSILTIILSFIINSKIIYPLFYDEIMKNVIGESKKVAKFISAYEYSNQYGFGNNSSTYEKVKNEFDIEKIKIFDENGVITYSSDKNDLGNKNTKEYFFNIVAKGEIYYKIVTKGTKTLEDRIVKRDVAEIYIPFVQDKKFKGALEIYYDITQKRESFFELMSSLNNYNILISIILISIVILMLFNASKNKLHTDFIASENIKKERIIHNQAKLVSMGEMIKNIAHQWRQPLSAITSSASALKLEKELGVLDNKSFDKNLDFIIKNGNFMSEIINNYRDYIDKRKDLKIIDIKEFISNNQVFLENFIKSSNIKVFYDLKLAKTKVNEQDILQIIINIINNSKEAFERNNIKNKMLFISTFSDEGKVYLKIKDNAGGIKKENIDKVFEPYFTTKHQKVGTGLGLYISKQILENCCNGSLEFYNVEFEYENKKYKGSEFFIITNNVS